MGQEIIGLLKKGGVGVLGTDTIYGLVGSALRPETVGRIYKLRDRESSKPMIVLISSIEDLSLFKIQLSKGESSIISKIWPGKVSVILPCSNDEFKYLHRGFRSIAFRLPDKKELVDLIKEAGPLVAPSVNPEGLPPATTIEEAKNYFGDRIDFYLDEGKVEGVPSTLIAIDEGKIVVERAGAVDVSSLLE